MYYDPDNQAPNISVGETLINQVLLYLCLEELAMAPASECSVLSAQYSGYSVASGLMRYQMSLTSTGLCLQCGPAHAHVKLILAAIVRNPHGRPVVTPAATLSVAGGLAVHKSAQTLPLSIFLSRS